jgi:two-component system chemotaxis response regulator CheY
LIVSGRFVMTHSGAHIMLIDFSTMPVYLVEPSHAQGKLITGMLAQHGVKNVTYFESATPMLAQCKFAPPMLVISALYLADMLGTELVQVLRESADTECVPFILISSETRPQVLEPVRQSGACAILPKPFSDMQLDTALRATLDYLDDDSPLELDDIDLNSLKVLLVDDSVSARNFIRRVLQNMGLTQFIEANNGSEATVILSETPVDLVVTDYNMPELDGKGLIEYIRQRSWQQTVPVLMVTSESNYSRLAAIEEAGVSGICDKPMETAILKTILTRILRQGR